MNANATTTEERNAPTTTLEQRDVRALTEHMSILGGFGDAEAGEYTVVSQSGKQYDVDVLTETCACPDREYRNNHCKHLRGVEFATGRREIPEWVDHDAINNTLGAHIDAGPVFAANVDAEPDAIAEPEATTRVATDGGVRVESNTDDQSPTIHDEDVDARLSLHSLAIDHCGFDELPDFGVYCATIEFATDALEAAVRTTDD